MPPRLMLVEDERIVAAALADQLRGQGYEIVANVGRAEQAIDEAIREHPDVMLVDINLGGEVDGVDAVRRIHEHARIATVFMTAYADEETMERIARITPIPCVRKPIEDLMLTRLLRLALYVESLRRDRDRLRAQVESLGGTTDPAPVLTPYAERKP